MYSSVEQIPLAAASIAQVHAAKLRTGEDVVIKVQKRGVQGSLKADLDLLYANARVLQLLGVVTAEVRRGQAPHERRTSGARAACIHAHPRAPTRACTQRTRASRKSVRTDLDLRVVA